MSTTRTKSTDLGAGWTACQREDGSMTVGNHGTGERIELEPASVTTLKAIFEQEAAKAV